MYAWYPLTGRGGKRTERVTGTEEITDKKTETDRQMLR